MGYQLINPDAIPVPEGNFGELEALATEMTNVGSSIAESTMSVNQTWQGLSASYDAPEIAQLQQVLTPTLETAETIITHLGSASEALTSYGSTMQQIQLNGQELKTSAQELVASAKEFDAEWTEICSTPLPSQAAVDAANRWHDEMCEWITGQTDELIEQANGLQEEWETAENGCAETLLSLAGAAPGTGKGKSASGASRPFGKKDMTAGEGGFEGLGEVPPGTVPRQPPGHIQSLRPGGLSGRGGASGGAPAPGMSRSFSGPGGMQRALGGSGGMQRSLGGPGGMQRGSRPGGTAAGGKAEGGPWGKPSKETPSPLTNSSKEDPGFMRDGAFGGGKANSLDSRLNPPGSLANTGAGAAPAAGKAATGTGNASKSGLDDVLNPSEGGLAGGGAAARGASGGGAPPVSAGRGPATGGARGPGEGVPGEGSSAAGRSSTQPREPLTDQDRAALTRHVEGSREENRALWGKDPMTPELEQRIAAKDAALAKLPNQQGTYRSSQNLSEGELNQLREAQNSGAIFENKGYLSASKGSGMAQGVNYVIKSRTGKDITQWAGERGYHEGEIVFPRGSRFKVLSVEPDPKWPGEWLVHMEQVL